MTNIIGDDKNHRLFFCLIFLFHLFGRSALTILNKFMKMNMHPQQKVLF